MPTAADTAQDLRHRTSFSITVVQPAKAIDPLAHWHGPPVPMRRRRTPRGHGRQSARRAGAGSKPASRCPTPGDRSRTSPGAIGRGRHNPRHRPQRERIPRDLDVAIWVLGDLPHPVGPLTRPVRVAPGLGHVVDHDREIGMPAGEPRHHVEVAHVDERLEDQPFAGKPIEVAGGVAGEQPTGVIVLLQHGADADERASVEVAFEHASCVLAGRDRTSRRRRRSSRLRRTTESRSPRLPLRLHRLNDDRLINATAGKASCEILGAEVAVEDAVAGSRIVIAAVADGPEVLMAVDRQPLTAPTVMPPRILRWKNRKTAMTGAAPMTTAAAISGMSAEYSP